MMKIYFYILFSFFLLKNIYSQSCTINNCLETYGECVNDVCLCAAGYTTADYNTLNNLNRTEIINKNDIIYCNYPFKYIDYAANFEALFPFGVGHFYSNRILHGLIKFFIFWFLSLNKIIFKKEIKLYPIIEKSYSFLLWVFAIFYLVDYAGYALDYYKDGNGMNMI